MDDGRATTEPGLIAAAIRHAVYQDARSQAAIARACGVHPTTLSLYLNCKIDAKGSTLDRLMGALRLRVVQDAVGFDAGGDSTASRTG